MSPPAVVLRGVRKVFDELVVLDGIDLEVAAGESVAVIGRSGSGKSTLLRLLMTLERPTAGTIEILGSPVWPALDRHGRPTASRSHLRQVRSGVGMVFQHFNLFPTMTALQNVAQGPRRVLRLDRDAARERGVELLRRVGLGSKLDRYPAQLSGGEQQRVAIARALALRPRLMLFDEITSALDPELVGDVLAVLTELARESGLTMLVVTHEMAFAGRVADRVAFLAAGRVVEEGPAARVLEDPADPRTRAFLEAVLRR